MKTYKQKKSDFRDFAINLQSENSTKSQSYSEVMTEQIELENKAKKLGLIKEFRENGIL